MGLTGAVITPMLPAGLFNSLFYLAVAVLGLVMAVSGARALHGPRRRIWSVIALGQAAYIFGDVLWVLFESVLHIDPFPSVADVAYLSWYPLIALGLVFLVREKHRRVGRAALLDAAIISIGLAVLVTEFLVLPVAQDGQGGVLSQTVAAAYPLGDLLLLSVLIGVFTSGAGRGFSFWALTAGIAIFLLADVQYVLAVAAGEELSLWLDALWLAGYLVVGFAAMHSSAAVPSEPERRTSEQFTILRLAFLGLALLLAPLTEALRDLAGHTSVSAVVLVGGTASVGLVLVRMWDLLRELHRQSAQLESLARSDSLTGLANRRTWDHELTRACDAAREHDWPLVAAIIDLDHFKGFNDTHGHVLGDLVLKETAAAWSQSLDSHGFLARFGGEEFTVLLPNSSAEKAEEHLERLRTAVSHGQTCSIGFAVWDGQETPDALVSRADQALYRAKHHGRNRTAFHNGSATCDSVWGDCGPELTTCAE